MSGWQEYISSLMRDGLCCDAAVISVAHQQLLAAHPGGVLANMTQLEIQVLLGRNRDTLLTKGTTLGGLRCLVIRDNLYTDTHNYTMDLRTKRQEENSDTCTYAITVALANPVCLILVGQKGIQGGTLNLKAFKMVRYIKNSMHQ
ncbi:Profilin-2 [Chelonia mydas]|uniref:Profilin n=1 Tax=Chelonia mydas TaxID=8469 RepID=M7AW02_CHEMY|nr:Profilin-2 [Chelonia mydas]